MREDTVRGQWKQIRARSTEWWSNLTEDDLDLIDGRREFLIEKLQERYGFSKAQAAQEVNVRVKELEQLSEHSRKD